MYAKVSLSIFEFALQQILHLSRETLSMLATIHLLRTLLNSVELTPCHYLYVPYSKNFGKYYFNHQSFFPPIFSTEGFYHTF